MSGNTAVTSQTGLVYRWLSHWNELKPNNPEAMFWQFPSLPSKHQHQEQPQQQNSSTSSLLRDATTTVSTTATVSQQVDMLSIDFQFPKDAYVELDADPAVQKVVDPMKFVQIPTLAHGLERVLTSPGLHLLRDVVTNQFNFTPFLQNIHQPEQIDFSSMPRFITTSQDDSLHKLAVRENVQFKASTSSISSIVVLFYMLFSNFRPANTECLSSFFSQTNEFTSTLKKPVSVILRPRDDCYSIDQAPGLFSPKNKILLDLGKSMEKMLTMPQQAFENQVLKNPTRRATEPTDTDAYTYLKVGDSFLLRSQLDCQSPHTPGENKVFDLKTRATHAIRHHCVEWYNHTSYRPQRVTGIRSSFEREYYDMIRGVFMKYSVQGRIGQMGGMFMTYHNTSEIFGFEYVTLDEIDRCVYGSKHMGTVSFDVSMKLFSLIAQTIVSRFPHGSLRLTFSTFKNSTQPHMEIFVERLLDDKGWIDSSMLPSNAAGILDRSNPFGASSEIYRYRLSLKTFVNSQLQTTAFHLTPQDKVRIFYELREYDSTATNSDLFGLYVKSLNRAFHIKASDLVVSEEEEEENEDMA